MILVSSSNDAGLSNGFSKNLENCIGKSGNKASHRDVPGMKCFMFNDVIYFVFGSTILEKAES